MYCFSLNTDCGRIRPRFKVGLSIFPIVFRPFPRPKLSLELQQNRTTLLSKIRKNACFLWIVCKIFQIVLKKGCFCILAVHYSREIAFEKCLWERISKKRFLIFWFLLSVFLMSSPLTGRRIRLHKLKIIISEKKH